MSVLVEILAVFGGVFAVAVIIAIVVMLKLANDKTNNRNPFR